MRLFVSLRPPPHAVEDLRAQRPAWPTPADRWHVTLAFLGDAAEPEPVRAALTAVLHGSPAFDLALEGSGTFGRGPAWVGVGGDLTALHALQALVARATTADPRPYRPHLTVGRRVDPRSLADYRGPTWTATEVELVRSDLRPVVRHTVLERYPLVTAASTAS